MQPSQSHQWSPPIGLVIAGWVLAGAAAVWLLAASSTVDRVFIGTVVLVLVAVSAYGSAVRPRLQADADGLAVQGIRGTRRWAWSAVTVRVQRQQRLGRMVETLELDTADEELVVLTRLDLGADPRDVAEALEQLNPWKRDQHA